MSFYFTTLNINGPTTRICKGTCFSIVYSCFVTPHIVACCIFYRMPNKHFHIDQTSPIKMEQGKHSEDIYLLLHYMSLFSYFQFWSDDDKNEFCAKAKLVNYAEGDTVVGDGVPRSDWVYFLLEGNCNVIENLSIEKFFKNGRWRYKLCEENELQQEAKIINKTSAAINSINITNKICNVMRSHAKKMNQINGVTEDNSKTDVFENEANNLVIDKNNDFQKNMDDTDINEEKEIDGKKTNEELNEINRNKVVEENTNKLIFENQEIDLIIPNNYIIDGKKIEPKEIINEKEGSMTDTDLNKGVLPPSGKTESKTNIEKIIDASDSNKIIQEEVVNVNVVEINDIKVDPVGGDNKCKIVNNSLVIDEDKLVAENNIDKKDTIQDPEENNTSKIITEIIVCEDKITNESLINLENKINVDKIVSEKDFTETSFGYNEAGIKNFIRCDNIDLGDKESCINKEETQNDKNENVGLGAKLYKHNVCKEQQHENEVAPGDNISEKKYALKSTDFKVTFSTGDEEANEEICEKFQNENHNTSNENDAIYNKNDTRSRFSRKCCKPHKPHKVETGSKKKILKKIKTCAIKEDPIKMFNNKIILKRLEDRTGYSAKIKYTKCTPEIQITTRNGGEKRNSTRQVDTHFMQVGVFLPKSVFGLGESITKNRRVVALTDVECMAVPRYWLLSRSNGTIWARIERYLRVYFPNSKELFKDFLRKRRWEEYKEDLIKSMPQRRTMNIPQNVPYSIRMSQDFAFAYPQKRKVPNEYSKKHMNI